MPESSCALYRVYGEQDRLLYVGISVDPQDRLLHHSRHKRWWHSSRRVTLEWFERRADAAKAELSAIRTERPKYNISFNPDLSETEEDRPKIGRPKQEIKRDMQRFTFYLETRHSVLIDEERAPHCINRSTWIRRMLDKLIEESEGQLCWQDAP